MKKKDLPFKLGWINNIHGIKIIWTKCKLAGFKYLRTRVLNQDPLENLFSIIRQHGAANRNLNCYQFVSVLKTSILNNLISYTSLNRNCENDEGSILDNFRDFLTTEGSLPKPLFEYNELLDLQVPPHVPISESDHFDTQALAYVCGFLIKKIKKIDCDCYNSLQASYPESQHTFTLFKEYDNVQRLKYATKDLINYVTHIYDISAFVLKQFGSILQITQKLKVLLDYSADFSWFTCSVHKDEIKLLLFKFAIPLIIHKILDTENGQFHDTNRSRYVQNKINVFRHTTSK